MQSVFNYLRYHAGKLNHFQVAGLVCLVLGLLLATATYAYINPNIMEEQQSLKHLKQRLALEALEPVENAESDALQLLDKTALYDVLNFIQTQADLNALQYSNVTYSYETVAEVKVLRYQVTYPFKASYVSLKKFLHAVLTEYHQTLVLSDFALTRDDQNQTILSGKVQLTLFLNDNHAME